MILQSMEIEGFKSFKTKQVFSFGNRKGVYFLAGDNQVDDSLGSNGAGKSTVWDALCWVLYGKTVRGLKAGDLLNWDADKKGYRVTLNWEDSNNFYKLQREWNPNSLLLSIGEEKALEVEQSRVDEVFGISYTPFLFSILMGQGRPMFFDLKEADKASLFSEVFLLDKWLLLSDEAAEDTKDLSRLLDTTDTSIIKNNEVLLALKKELASLRELKTNWDNDKSQRLAQAVKKVNELIREKKNLLDDLRTCVNDKELLKTDFLEVTKEIQHAGNIVYKTEDRLRDIDSELVQCKEHVNIKKKEIDYFRGFSKGGNYPCTLCGQVVHNQYANKQIVSLKKDIKKLGSEYTEKVLGKRRWKDRLIKSKEELSELEAELKELQVSLDKVSSHIAFAKGSLAHLKKEITSKKESMCEIKDEPSPFNTSIRGVNQDIYYIMEDLCRLSRIREAVSSKKEQTQYWIKGFKDVRLYMLSEFLIQLELEVCNALAKLGLPDWRISFDVEKETKSKTIKKGFHVLIHSPLNDSPVPWESWSGGESQRLRLAGNMGLSSLILGQYGVTPNVEIWDEPSSHLGKEGVSDLMETLYDRAQIANKCLWVIEHNVLDFGEFNKVVTISKTESGSIITNETREDFQE